MTEKMLLELLFASEVRKLARAMNAMAARQWVGTTDEWAAAHPVGEFMPEALASLLEARDVIIKGLPQP